MDRNEMQGRTKQFALRVMSMIDHLPNSVKGRVLADQLMRSATSVAANYRAACRARSKKEFVAKLGIALEEADESQLWIGLIIEGEVLPRERLLPLEQEADEICAILFCAWRTGRESLSKS